MSNSQITRRQAVGLAGAASAAAVVAATRGLDAPAADAQTPGCVLTPAKTEGPYFVDERLNRSDIREGEAGTRLDLALVVVNAACAPVAGAQVDIWHANAGGSYSDVAQNGTVGKKYLRGYQVTGADGKASFTTIFPGWYQGRAIHIHFKVRVGAQEFTSQLFFDPATSQQVVSAGAYAGRGQPDTSNASDNIYGSDGSKLLVSLQRSGDGYAGTFTIGLAGLSSTPNTAGATLTATKFRRTKTGRRILRVTLTTTEALDVTARLSRSGATLVRKNADNLAAGTRTLDLRVPLRSAGGTARLTVLVSDSAGATKTLTRSVTVPKRRS